MKNLAEFALIALVAVTLSAQAAPPEGEGWRSLFNGENLDGWENKSGHAEIWQVKDGVIDCNPRVDLPGDKTLWSKESFRDFRLYIEWRIKGTKGEYPVPTVLPDGSHKLDENGNAIITMMPNADSGIYLRAPPNRRSTSGAGPSARARSMDTAWTTKCPPKCAPASPPK